MAIREIGELGVGSGAKWMEQSRTEWNKIIVIKIKEKYNIITTLFTK